MPSPHDFRANAIFNDTSSDGWGTNVSVQVIRRLGPTECDAEVGPMYKIIRADGRTRDAFRDELTTISGKAFSLRNPDTATAAPANIPHTRQPLALRATKRNNHP